MHTREDAKKALVLGERIFDLVAPELAGHPSTMQGAALAELLAMWLAGHIVIGNETETKALRERLLAAQLDLVRKLVDASHQRIHGRPLSS